MKLLLAEGMVVENSQNDGTGHIGCAAPILRTIMLSNIRDPDIVPISPTDADRIDPKWLLARTVEVDGCSKLYLLLVMKQFVYIY